MFFSKKNFDFLNGFDENFFLYFEENDFCLRSHKINKNYQINNIKVKHDVGKSVEIKNEKEQIEQNNLRTWHFIWSKFYYYKKNYNYLFALKKIIPNIIKSIKKIIFSLITFNKENLIFGLIEFYGIICSILNLKSFYRPRM